MHEIKKSNKVEEAHEWQLKYYLLLLHRAGVKGVTGLLEYPKLKKITPVTLLQENMERLEQDESEIEQLIKREQVPGKIKKSFCRRCSYFDLCWVE